MSNYKIKVIKNFVTVIDKRNPGEEVAYFHITDVDAFTKARRIIEQLEPKRDKSGRFVKLESKV